MNQNTNSNINTSATEKMAQEIQKLMSEGKTLEEALQQVVTVKTVSVGRRDTLAYIKECRNIPEVRRLKKIAYAKISKSKGKLDAIARYKEEIKVAEDRLNDLIKEVNAAEIPWQKAMELGEDADAAFNYFFSSFKEQVDKALDKATKSMTRAQVKAELQTTTPKLPSKLPELLQPAMQKRMDNQDMQVITTAKKLVMYNRIKKAQ